MRDLLATTNTGADTVLQETAVEALQSNLCGMLLRPHDDNYDEVRTIWNGMMDKRPALIVRCTGVADVIAAVNFAHAHQLLVAVRGGGHNVAGYAACDGGIMIDLSLMRGVRVDPQNQRVWAQGGATWGDVDRETQVFGLATPGGVVSATGIAGLTLAGGLGWLRGKYGLCIDNLLSVDIVTADGQFQTASEAENSDLFWGVRGGGGNFGIVTSFEFRLHPVGPLVMFCAPVYPAEHAGKIIRSWRDFMATAPDELGGTLVEFSTIPDAPDYPQEAWGTRVVTVAMVYAGPADEGERVVRPLRELGKPIIDFSGQMPYCAVQTLFDPLFPKGKHQCYWKSLYLNSLETEVIDAIVSRAANPPSKLTFASLWYLGGAPSRVAADATAFGDRRMPYMLSIDSIWESPRDTETNIAWTRAFWADMKRFSSGRLYLNFPGLGEEGEELVRTTYGTNYKRLVALKNKYDPTNLFRLNQNIKPAV